MKECMVGIPGILLTVCEFCSIMNAIDRTWQKKASSDWKRHTNQFFCLWEQRLQISGIIMKIISNFKWWLHFLWQNSLWNEDVETVRCRERLSLTVYRSTFRRKKVSCMTLCGGCLCRAFCVDRPHSMKARFWPHSVEWGGLCMIYVWKPSREERRTGCAPSTMTVQAVTLRRLSADLWKESAATHNFCDILKKENACFLPLRERQGGIIYEQ